MRILFAGNKTRGVRCLRALVDAGHDIVGVLAHPDRGVSATETVASAAQGLGLRVLQPADPNNPGVLGTLREWGCEIGVLAGYSPIVGEAFFDLPRLGCVNLHGGKLPEYRGSSPMNWALINGESEVTFSVLQVDRGVDTGDVLAQRTVAVGLDDTIADVERQANDIFPAMLTEVIAAIANGTVTRRRQDQAAARYFPLRFPEDGLILWDALTARQIHNRVRALTHPFPGAFALYDGRRVTLLRSKLPQTPVFGEPGRVYRKSDRGLLVCGSDQCVWIQQAVFADSGENAFVAIERYASFTTLRGLALGMAGPMRSA